MQKQEGIFKGLAVTLVIVLMVTGVCIPEYFNDSKIYAEDSQSEYKVRFNLNGGIGSASDRTVSKGGIIGPMPIVSKTGYSLVGWFTSDGVQKYADSKVTSNLNLTARWSPNRYVITFDANGGKVSINNKQVVFDSEHGSLPKPKKTRNTFLGWYTAKSGGSKVTSSTLVTRPESTTLYARWKKSTKVKYTFNGNRGSVNKKTKSYKYDKKISKLPVPKRKGFTFMGWYTSKHGGKKIYNGKKATTTLSEDTLYARWAPRRFKQSSRPWGSMSYGGDTIGSAGCGPTAMAMVVNALKDTSITPKQAAKWSVKQGYKTSARGKTKAAFFTKYPAKFGIESTKINSGDLRKMSPSKARVYHNKAKQEVKDGNWVICFMGPGHWAAYGHYILWYNVSGDNALIRDPSGRNEKARAKNKISKLRKTVIKYYVIEVPENKKVR